MSRFGLVPFTHPWSSWREPSRDIWNSRLMDQHFGLGLADEDFIVPSPPSTSLGLYLRPRRLLTRQQSGLSEVKCDAERFRVNLDVNQFTPEELIIKTIDKSIVVHGKHEEKIDEHGFIAREFTRRYLLPDDILPESVTSSLSHDGILTIEAPRKALEAPKPNERIVSINRPDVEAIKPKVNA